MSYQKELRVATEVVRKAGDIIRNMRETGQLEKTVKPDESPVTNADIAAERLLKEELSRAFPDYGFLGEEGTNIRKKDYTWICDPIDGTRAYLNGEKTVATSLALHNKEKGLVLGIVYNPFTKEMYASANGLETKVDEMSLPAKNPSDLRQAVVNYGLTKTNMDTFSNIHELWREKKISKLVSVGGSIAYQLAQVAEGAQSVYMMHSTKTAKSWDIAAGIHLVRGVGGKVTDEEGKDIMEGDEPTTIIAATNETIHRQFLEALREVRAKTAPLVANV